MSFEQGISGLNAASKSLEVIGNNIANANTIGAKSSRAEFSDLYADSLTSQVGKNAGTGVQVAAVAQQFTQGTISTTGNDLDLAINGNGFFQVTRSDGTAAYTRAGQFKMDNQGNVVNNNGDTLTAYATDTSGVRLSSLPAKLQLPTNTLMAANATSSVSAAFNLDASTPTATASTAVTSIGSSLNVYDSLGIAIPLSLYFSKTASANTWNVYTSESGATPTLLGGLSFNADGTLKQTLDSTGTATGSKLLSLSLSSSSGATTPFTASVDFSAATQLGATFSVSALSQDGYAPGQLSNLKVSAAGLVQASYTNGQTQAVGQVALTNFRNPQGLSQLGGGDWGETAASGAGVRGAPGEGVLGSLQSGALEESNVDLTAELVNMMTSQRAYQANAQTIKTMDQVLQTLINLH